MNKLAYKLSRFFFAANLSQVDKKRVDKQTKAIRSQKGCADKIKSLKANSSPQGKKSWRNNVAKAENDAKEEKNHIEHPLIAISINRDIYGI